MGETGTVGVTTNSCIMSENLSENKDRLCDFMSVIGVLFEHDEQLQLGAHFDIRKLKCSARSNVTLVLLPVEILTCYISTVTYNASQRVLIRVWYFSFVYKDHLLHHLESPDPELTCFLEVGKRVFKFKVCIEGNSW